MGNGFSIDDHRTLGSHNSYDDHRITDSYKKYDDHRIYDSRDQSTVINNGPVWIIQIQNLFAGDGTKWSGISDAQAGDIVRAAGPDGISRVCDSFRLDGGKKQSAVAAACNGDSNRAGQILLEAGREKMRMSTRQLSADAGGRKSLRSVHGTYLRAPEPGTAVELVHGQPGNWENWYIEDWGAKVVLKARGAPNKPGRFLQAHAGGHVDLSYKHPKDCEGQMWKPFKNDDGSWALLSVHGQWLSARQDGSLCTVQKCDAWEHFWLQNW